MRSIFYISLGLLLLTSPLYATNTLVEKDNGLYGYIYASIDAPPNNFGYGISYYTSIWSLLAKPLANFQVGLPSTWLIPNNNNFTQLLCPPGSYSRQYLQDDAANYYRDDFETIEGGAGVWQSTQFATTTPKYRINGTPDCYNNEVSSPGWGFGNTTSLKPNLMGLAQLSNHILMPPDGFTFNHLTNHNQMGIAWMALPITPGNNTTVPTGDQTWTFFINTANFAGPVAFYLPTNWSRLSKNYHIVNGRGLDTQPAIANGGAMEVNSVPYFEATDEAGAVYSRIPRLRFPINSRGETILLRDIYYYSQASITRL